MDDVIGRNVYEVSLQILWVNRKNVSDVRYCSVVNKFESVLEYNALWVVK
jgi:hypothetical protein